MIEPLIRILVRIGLRKVLDTQVPEARIADAPADPIRWVRLGIFFGVLIVGWIFIGWQNRFHVTAPVVFVCLGYLAVIAMVYNLWRTGAAAVAPEHVGEEAWARPAGPRGDLEKAKRTLLKAIKEAEFDHEMGKLSKVDADDLIRTYRGRAIEVIKEIDRIDAGEGESVRARIDREVKARLAVHDHKAANKKAKKPVKPDATAGGDAAATAGANDGESSNKGEVSP